MLSPLPESAVEKLPVVIEDQEDGDEPVVAVIIGLLHDH